VGLCIRHGLSQERHPRDASGRHLLCGKHGAQFAIETGLCNDGPCLGERLESVEVVIDEDEICVVGVSLAEEDGLDRRENDEAPEVVITSE